MAQESHTDNTGMLQLESLQLDVQTLQRCREEDKQEFVDFSQSIRKNFASIQTNFTNIQTNFERLFATRKEDNFAHSPLRDSRNTLETPENPGHASNNSIKQPMAPTKPIGTRTLQDMTCRELNLDGTVLEPYRHPHYGRVTTDVHDNQQRGNTTAPHCQCARR